MSYKILVINPGSTSTKIGVYEDEQLLFDKTLRHSAEDIAQFNTIPAQKDWRRDLVMKALREQGFDARTLSAVSGRGGLLRPIRGGTYAVNDNMVKDCTIGVQGQHASNLGGLIAREIGDELGIPSYIVDPVVIDEMADVARYAGHPLFQRVSIFHALNQKAVAKRFAKEQGKKYEELNLIVCHMGGGVSIGAHMKGNVVDTQNALDGEGPFSPERSGSLPTGQLVKQCFSGKYTEGEMHRMLSGRGGLVAYTGSNDMRYLLAHNGEGCDVTVIEGVMGYYDGLGLTSTRASTYEAARETESPVVLVVNARGAALSVLAAAEGFLHFAPDSGIRGVILNGCSAMSYGPLARGLENRLGVRACGYLPRLPECALESRHLGLVTADEVADLQEKLRRLAAEAEKTLDIAALLEIAAAAPPLRFTPPVLPEAGAPVRIGVARDRAFCFYYEDSLDLLRQLGAELIPFSPLADERLPDGVQGLYLGGGYPELYAAQLAENRTLRGQLREAVHAGMPCIAECGGFMYLTQTIAGHAMVGALPGDCFDTGKLTRFGYITATAQEDSLLCHAGERVPMHEFHHWDTPQPGGAFLAEKPSGKRWRCAYATDTLYAGFPHFHFYAKPAMAQRFLAACRKETL